MEDDIDIEEHDLMDNPRIKSIFPDLSCVKIEVPDEEELEEEYEKPPIYNQPQEMLYQYEYSFETTAENLPEENAEDNNEYDDSDDNGFFYNNEIILGSKPPINEAILYEEALNSRPMVYLEDWEDRLKKSPCFCDTCAILFPTVNALDAHKMISHSYLIALDIPRQNTARKSTVTSKYCNHCSKTFPDDTSLIKHLYELLPLNNFPNEEKVETETPQYKCQKCKQTFVTYVASQQHKKSDHPTLGHVNNLICRIKPEKVKIEPKKIKIEPKKIKIEPKKIKIEPKEVKLEVVEGKDKDLKGKIKSRLSKEGKFFAKSSLVPKSVLFQCNVCQVGFLSCFAALQHSKLCDKIVTAEKCDICKRNIRTKDVRIHKLQHNYADKLKIYTVNKSIYEKVMCKCPKCLACFDEIGFWAHYQKCKNFDKKSTYCPICDVHVGISRYESHRTKHTSKKFTKKDFIVIEFHDQRNMKAAHISQQTIEMTRIQRIRERNKRYRDRRKKMIANIDNDQSGDKVTLYYCQFCGCCQYIFQSKSHADGACLKSKYQSKQFCGKCGLCFSKKSMASHLVLHEKRQFSLKDITIYSLATGAEIDPPTSELIKCEKCDKHFLYPKLARLHDCKTEKHITCKICSKKFNLQAYKVHKIFHSVDKLMPELMKKYNSINNMWNVIYMCSACDLVTMTYDSAVTHSQGHLNYIISDLKMHCDVCNLDIAEKEFSNHEILHNNNQKIERGSFRILKYNYEDLFKKEWMTFFRPLPKQHRLQILSKSIYRYTRSIKMQIVVSAPTDDIKYLCMNCNRFVDGPNIAQHIKTKCSRNNKYICVICHEVFKTLKQFIAHEGSHEKVPKRHTIVTFNNECDVEFNIHLSLIEAESKNVTKKSVEASNSKIRELLTDGVKKTYKIYKCSKCHVCMSLKSSSRRHRCGGESERKFCQKCDQYFSSKKYPWHMEAHRKKPSVTKHTLTVIFFNGVDKKPGVHPVKVNPGKRVNPIKVNPGKRVNPIKVNPGKRVNPVKVNPVKVHPVKDVHPVKVNPPKEAHTELMAKIFKCECGLHFTSMRTIQNHLDVCSSDLEVSKETCSKCKLLFSTDVLVTHLVNHHSKEMKIEIEKIVKVNLFKCSHCVLFFTGIEYYYDHMEKCDPKNGKECTQCRLNFGNQCFAKHRCTTKDTTYLTKITTMTDSVKLATVYKCEQCDISYLQYKSFKYHVLQVNHLNKIPLLTCEYCGLKFTNFSYLKHIKMHSCSNEEYRIKIINPVSGDSVTITGSNSLKNNEIVNFVRTSRKRKRGIKKNEAESDEVKKPKKSLDDNNLSDRRSKRSTKFQDKPSTSKDSVEYNTEDEINESEQKNENDSITDSEIYDTSNEINKSKTDTSNFVSNKLKARIQVHKYGNKLYRCVYCHQHYMKDSSFDYHIKTYNHFEKPENFKCDICDLDFSKYTLPRHKYVHHQCMGLKSEDFIVLTETGFTRETKIFEKIDSVLKVAVNDIEVDNAVEIIDDIVSEVCETNSDDTENVNNDSDKICYYKCANCNVCFINQKICYDHTLKHETLDPKMYIQCKICNFQFMIDSLKEHMDIHHNVDFMVENLTIHEYRCVENGLDPKIDIYQAVDKVQSGLISTTTDVGVV